MESVYIETTVISFLVARPSRDPFLAECQRLTREWWESDRHLFRCVTSDEVVREARRGEAEMVLRRLEVLATLETIELTEEMHSIAARFMKTRALPPQMASDALHLAVAMISKSDYLLTWNCRHLSNAQILRRLQVEAIRMGSTLPTVCAPHELKGAP